MTQTSTIGTAQLTRRERRAIARLEAASAMQCTLADLLFPVEKRENPRKTNSEYNFTVTGVVEGDEMDLNYCSNRYALIPNAEIFPKIEAILDAAGIRFEVSYSHIDHVRFYADYKITDPRYGYTMKGSKGDKIMPIIRVQHSYNGLTKYKIIVGYFRVVCTNGLVIAIEEMKKFNLVLIGKHTESVKRSLEQLMMMLGRLSTEAKEITAALTAKYELLASIDYKGGSVASESVKKRIEDVLKAGGLRAVDQKQFNAIDHIYGRVLNESTNAISGYNGKITDWLIYNAINQYVYDNSLNSTLPEKRMEIDSKIFEYMLKFHN